MRLCIKLLIVFLFTPILSNGFACANDVIEVESAVAPETGVDQTTAKSPPLKAHFNIDKAARIKLDGLPQNTIESIVDTESIRMRVGIERKIDKLSNTDKTKDLLTWEPLQDGGNMATLLITSPTASSLRIGLAITELPKEAELRFFTSDGEAQEEIYLVTGKQILDLVKLNLGSEPNNPDARTYWSPAVEGSSIGLEIYLPPGIDVDSVQISIPSLSHLGISPYGPTKTQLDLQGYGDSNPCQNDATCYSNWSNIEKATAKMIFTQSGYSYLCTGTLLNDLDTSTWKPYFISANHCISTQTVSSTLQTLWRYESSTCNGSTRSSSYAVNYGGAQLLWTKGMTLSQSSSSMDTSLFKLNNAAPRGIVYAGWTTALISSGTKTGVHHPKGDWTKISFANYSGVYTCWGPDSFNCTPSSSGNFYRVDWIDGGTEGGSSGSGLYHNTSQLIADLTGGNGSCEGSQGYYSSFRNAYIAGDLGKWLYIPTPESSQTIVPILYELLLDD